MTGEAHKRAVLKILDRLPDARTKGFFADLRAALREDGDPEWDRPDDIRVVPDAFLIDRREKTLIVFEVERRTRSTMERSPTTVNCIGPWTIGSGGLAS
jgi:hypothetical protein